MRTCSPRSRTRRARHSLLAGDAEEAARHFERAIGLLHEVAAPFETALTKLRAGPAFVAAGDRDVGVDCIVDAYRTFRRLGAQPFAARAAAVLKELGEPVDRRLGRRAAGELERGGLTRRELEVLRLVAVGRTNAEIATELVLSPRTIEMHVANALAKTRLPLAHGGDSSGARAGHRAFRERRENNRERTCTPAAVGLSALLGQAGEPQPVAFVRAVHARPHRAVEAVTAQSADQGMIVGNVPATNSGTPALTGCPAMLGGVRLAERPSGVAMSIE